MLVRSGSGKEGAAAASLLPGRVTFPSQAGMCSGCGAPLLHWRAGAVSSQLPSDSRRQGSTGGPSGSLLPDLSSSTLSRAGSALLSRGVPGRCRAPVPVCELLAAEMCSGAGAGAGMAGAGGVPLAGVLAVSSYPLLIPIATPTSAL